MNQKRKTEAPQIPAFRFSGFSEEWEEKKVQNFSANTVGGGTPQTGNVDYWNGDLAWIQSSDLKDGQFYTVEPTKFITNEALENSAAKKIPANSIAIVTRVGVGKLAYMRIPYATSQDFLSLVDLKLDPYFAIYTLAILMEREKLMTQGTSIKGVTKSELLSRKCLIPLRKEQTQIGEFFQTIDRLIELQSEKVAKAEYYKKAMLQKLFPQKGETIPKLRFAGFSGEWEEVSLGKVFNFSRGEAFAKKDITDTGDNSCLHYGELFTEYKSVIYQVISKTNLEAKKPSKVGDILMPSSDVTPDGLAKASCLMCEGVLLGGDINVLRLKKDGSPIFYSYLINTYRNKILSLVTGSSVKHLYNSDLKNIKYFVPTPEEQTQIGNFFQILDKQIEAEGQKLERYQTLKRAMLQRMFV